MSKQDFLNSLRAALGNELGAAAAEENVKYYEEYINAEIRVGKSEEEVLASLGNPKLIARSIIDAEGGKTNTNGSYGQGADYRSDGEYVGGNHTGSYGSAGSGANRKSGVRVRKMPLWLIVLLVVVVICVIFGALVMFVWWLAPIIVVFWLLGFVLKSFRGKK